MAVLRAQPLIIYFYGILDSRGALAPLEHHKAPEWQRQSRAPQARLAVP